MAFILYFTFTFSHGKNGGDELGKDQTIAVILSKGGIQQRALR